LAKPRPCPGESLRPRSRPSRPRRPRRQRHRRPSPGEAAAAGSDAGGRNVIRRPPPRTAGSRPRRSRRGCALAP
jgi:hypothetical protein